MKITMSDMCLQAYIARPPDCDTFFYFFTMKFDLRLSALLLASHYFGAHSFKQMQVIRSLSQRNVMSASEILKNPDWPAKWPFSPVDFTREDQSNDGNFYYQPRLVYHIDEYAVDALTKYYSTVFRPNSAILDICSSWVSHYPPTSSFARAVGLGMNEQELSQNRQLSEYVVQDLNKNTVFPFADNSFDYVTCVVSVDYLIHPLEVFTEIRRVLKPGGLAIFSQSNRCFPSKAIKIWLETNDFQVRFLTHL